MFEIDDLLLKFIIFLDKLFHKKNNPLKERYIYENFSNCNIWNINEYEIKYLKRFKIGKETYGNIHCLFYPNSGILSIGNYCSIADDVHFLLGGCHPYKGLTTYPTNVIFSKILTNDKIGNINITVKDDVWIGYGATIMGNVTIGQGAIIGAKAVITKDVEPYSIVVGANKCIKYRFEKDIINELLSWANYLNFNKKKFNSINTQTEITRENINYFKSFFK